MNYRYKQFFTHKITAYKDADVWVLRAAGYTELRIKVKSMRLRDAFDFYIELYLIPRDEEQKRKYELSEISEYKDSRGNYFNHSGKRP